MRDIELNSAVLRLKDFPPETTKVMINYDSRGWAIRCYSDNADSSGNKITTMVPDKRLGDSGSDVTLVPFEQL